jgi:hypothetical protein
VDGFDLATLVGFTGIPVVTALVQVVKVSFPTLDSRWWPLLSLAVAVGLNLGAAAALSAPLGQAAVWGLLTGLAASGLYTWARSRTTPPAS